jgi:hypothetical protein
VTTKQALIGLFWVFVIGWYIVIVQQRKEAAVHKEEVPVPVAQSPNPADLVANVQVTRYECRLQGGVVLAECVLTNTGTLAAQGIRVVIRPWIRASPADDGVPVQDWMKSISHTQTLSELEPGETVALKAQFSNLPGYRPRSFTENVEVTYSTAKNEAALSVP